MWARKVWGFEEQERRKKMETEKERSRLKERTRKDFPDIPVVKTSNFPCGEEGHGSNPWLKN